MRAGRKEHLLRVEAPPAPPCDPELFRDDWLAPLSCAGFRSVEDQHRSSTRHLVDDEQEHELLEGILERAKPSGRVDSRPLDYLLKTPFRYPPLRHGSRFGRVSEPGIFYGSVEERTCLGETAYYQMSFLRGALGARFVTQEKRFTTFPFSVTSARAVDFTAPPHEALRPRLSHPQSYEISQTVGSALRARSAGFCRFWSARVPGGANVAVLDPEAFSKRTVSARDQRVWYVSVSLERLIFAHKASETSHTFRQQDFLVDGAWPPIPG